MRASLVLNAMWCKLEQSLGMRMFAKSGKLTLRGLIVTIFASFKITNVPCFK